MLTRLVVGAVAARVDWLPLLRLFNTDGWQTGSPASHSRGSTFYPFRLLRVTVFNPGIIYLCLMGKCYISPFNGSNELAALLENNQLWGSAPVLFCCSTTLEYLHNENPPQNGRARVLCCSIAPQPPLQKYVACTRLQNAVAHHI